LQPWTLNQNNSTVYKIFGPVINTLRTINYNKNMRATNAQAGNFVMADTMLAEFLRSDIKSGGAWLLDSQVILYSTSKALNEEVEKRLEQQITLAT